MSDKIDDLFVSLNVDLSGLDSGLNDAVGKVQKAGDSMAGAFNGAAGGIEPLDASLNKLGVSAAAAGEGAKQATQGYLDLRPAIAGTGQAAEAALGPIESMLASLQKVALQFLAFNAIKNAVEEAVSAFSHLERATLSLTALTGSAEKAGQQLQTLRDLSISNALSFPSLIDAAQRMTAFGFAASQIPRAMQAAADAAASTNKDFSQVSQSMDRMALSGMASGRMLATMGISVIDLAKQMHMMGAATLDVQHAFSALDEGGRLEVLMGAMEKFAGVAGQAALSVAGRWQNLKTEITQIAVEIVAALDSTMKELMQSFGGEVLPGLRNMADGFKDLAAAVGPVLLPVVKDAIETFGALLSVIGGLEKVISTILSPLDMLAEKMKSSGVATEHLHGGFLNISTMGLAKVAQDIAALASSLQNYDARATAAAASSKAFADETNRLKSYIDGLRTPLQGVIADWHSQQLAIESARTGLAAATEAYNLHKVGLGAVTQAQEALNRALQAADPSLKAAGAAAKAAANFNEQFAQSITKAMDGVKNYEAGTATLSSTQNALNAIMETASLKWDKLSEASKNLVISLIPLTNELNDAAKAAGIAKLTDEITKLSITYVEQFGRMDVATVNFLSSVLDMDGTLANLKGMEEVIKAAREFLATQKELDASEKQLNSTFEAGHKAVISFGAEMEKSFQGGKESVGQLAQKIKEMGLEAGFTGQLIIEMLRGINDLGFQSQQQMEHQIAVMQRTLDLATQFHQPFTILLGLQAQILQAQINENVALGASGEATLAWMQKLEAVKILHQAIHDQTLGLSILYTGMIQTFGKAWDEAGKGIADAVVSGQNFGAVMSSVLDNLKKSLAELVTKYFMTQLKDAILTNTGLMKSFNDAFGFIFGQGGTVAKGMGLLDKTVTQTASNLADATKTATEGITKATSTASTGITQIATKAMSSIFSLVSVVSAVISAITGIIGNIEMAHMEKTLGQIETNTRQIFNAVGGGSESIAGTSKLSSQILGGILETIQGTVITLLNDISGNLDSIAADIHSGVIGLGGTGGGGSSAALASTVRDLQNTVQQLTQDVMGPYGLGASVQGLGGATSTLSDTSYSLSTATYDLTAATTDLASASTVISTSLTAATKSLDQVALVAVAAVAAANPGVMQQIAGAALGSQVQSAPGVLADVPGSRGFTPIATADTGGYSAVQNTPGGWQNMNVTIHATPSVADLGHQLMDFLRLQGVTA